MKHTLPTFALTLAALLPALPSAAQVPDQLKYTLPVPQPGVSPGTSDPNPSVLAMSGTRVLVSVLRRTAVRRAGL